MKISKIPLSSRNFYNKHPDLMPRNIYLYLGRIKSKEQIDNEINKVFKLTPIEKCRKLFSRIKQVIK